MTERMIPENPAISGTRPCPGRWSHPVGHIARRSLLATAAAGCLAITPFAEAQTENPAGADDPKTIGPQRGDRFAFLAGEKKGQVVKADDLPLGGPQVQAYPIDPNSGLVRDGSRLNLIVLIRVDPSSLDEETRARAAEGVVAYSGVCTHQGCAVNMWTGDNENGFFVCSCHASVYDPRNGAQVMGGPAPRPLPSLSLKLEDGVPVVAAGFSGHVGPTTH
jgi:Rieske Fe-S protein